MKKITILVYIILVVMLVLQSCSVDKRLYMKGYNIERNTKDPVAQSEDVQLAARKSGSKVIKPEVAPNVDNALTASSDESCIILQNSIIETVVTNGSEAVAQFGAAARERESVVIPDATAFLMKNSVIETTTTQRNSEWAAAHAQHRAAARDQAKHPFLASVKNRISEITAPDDVRPHWMAILSLVLGILSLVAYYGAFPLGILAIIFGAIALKNIRNNPSLYRGRGMALAGMICGIVAIAIILTILLMV